MTELLMSMGHPVSISAVITGDIVNSTRIPVLKEKRLLKRLEKELSDYDFGFYRGDSLQVYIEDPLQSLRIVLICRTLAISLADENAVRPDIRFSIGVGKVQLPVRMPDNARGEAFVLSGRRLDEIMDTEERLSIRSGQTLADIGFQILADYLDSIYRQMTVKQAIVFFYLLHGQTQQEVAAKLGKSKSTISELAGAGRWPEVEKLLQQFEMLINQLL